MARLERRLFVRSVGIGVIVTAAVLLAGALGWLDTLENFLYDQRALYCQILNSPPTNRIAHLDIDDASIDAIGRWPWPRATMARLVDEIEIAKPSAVCMDIMFSEAEPPRIIKDVHGQYQTIDDDTALANVFTKYKNVVLATSFKVESTKVDDLPGSAQAEKWFQENLELTEDDFYKKVAAASLSQPSDAKIDDLFIRSRRSVLKARIDEALSHGDIPEEQLTARLLPNTDLKISSPLVHVFSSQYKASMAARAVFKFGTPSQTLTLLAVHGAFDQLPVPKFSTSAIDCAFVNYDLFGSPEVRYIPLYVEFDHRLYPQMGLASACAILGANPANVRFEQNQIVIPAPDRIITIPTINYYSRPLGREIPLITPIPWFGTTEWQTMYDPTHRTSAAHASLATVWDICMSQDKIAKNNANIDAAVVTVLAVVDADKATKYAAGYPPPEDFETRHSIAENALERLKSSGLLDLVKATPANELDDDSKKVVAAVSALNSLLSENQKLVAQIQSQRRNLSALVNNKGVLIGFTAAGMLDQVTTSIHPHAPGVVVHGVIANAILTNHWWRTVPPYVAKLLIVIFGIGISIALCWFSPLRGAALMLFTLSAYAIVNGYILFAWKGLIMDAAGPMVAIVAVWACVTLYHLVAETIERYRIATEVAIINKEMDLARNVQVALIPTEPPKVEGLEAQGWALPASVTGGDCYDLWQLADGRLAIVVADASGHGLAPAMIVSQVRTLMRALCDLEPHPHGLLARVNTRVASDLEANRFITAFLGFISPDGKLDWASAGHGPMYWCSASGGEILELESTGMPLGIQTEWLADEPAPPLKLNDSGMLVVFSDGINESRSPTGEMFGTDRVKEIIRAHSSATSAEVIAAIRTAVQSFQQKTEPIDDQTVVVVKRIQKPGIA